MIFQLKLQSIHVFLELYFIFDCSLKVNYMNHLGGLLNINIDVKLFNRYLRNCFEDTHKPNSVRQLSAIIKTRLARTASKQSKHGLSDEHFSDNQTNRTTQLSILQDTQKLTKQRKQYEGNHQSRHEAPEINQSEWPAQKLSCYQATNHNQRKQFLAKTMKRLYGLSPKSQNHQLPDFKTVVQKRGEYAKALVYVSKREFQLKDKFDKREWLKCIQLNTNIKLWKIIIYQLEGITLDQAMCTRSMLMKDMLINSLKLIQKQLDEELTNKIDMDSYLDHKYLSKLDPSSYIFRQPFGCIWGKAFLLFRAGRDKQLHELLNLCGYYWISQLISLSNQAIAWRKPIKLSNFYEAIKEQCMEKDIFRQHILCVLQGEMNNCELLYSDSSIENTWLILRSKGIYCDANNHSIKQQITKILNYKPKDLLYYLAYLLDYDSIVKMGQNELIDQDDYIHLLIILNKFTFLMEDPTKIQQILADNIERYVSLLGELGEKGIFQYYLLMISGDKFVHRVSQIIVNNNLYSICQWEILKQILAKQHFEELLKITTQKYIVISGNYSEGGCNLMKMCPEGIILPSLAFDWLIRQIIIIIKHNQIHLKNMDRQTHHQITELLAIISKKMEQQPQLKIRYHLLIKLLENEVRLSRFLADRNLISIMLYYDTNVINDFFSILEPQLELKRAMLGKLKDLDGADVIYLWIKHIVESFQLIIPFAGVRENQMNCQKEQIIKKIQSWL